MRTAEKVAMNCPYPSCNQEINEPGSECARCSRKVRTCTECQWTNRALARFCRRCGRKLQQRPEWPLVRRDAGGTACAPTGINFDRLGADSLRSVWPSHRIGTSRDRVLSPPAVEHGLLVVCSSAGRLSVLNRYNRDSLAETQIETDLQDGECSAAFHEHLLVAAGGSTVRCFNLLHGFQGWQSNTFPLVQEWECALNGEQVYRPILTLQASSGACVLVVTQAEGESRVHALSLQDGRSIWQSPVHIQCAISALAAGEGRHAYVLAEDGRVHAIEIVSGRAHASTQMRIQPRVDLPPVWRDDTLFIFDAEGALCTCPTSGGTAGVPSRMSDATLQVVTGFAVAPQGVLVSCSRGLAMLSRTGRRLWIGEGNMDAAGSPPVIAGDIGFAIGQNQAVLYACDLNANSPRYRPIHLSNEPFVSGPAVADNVLYACSLFGEVFSIRIDGT